MEENKIKTYKIRCDICGKTVKRIVTKESDKEEIERNEFIKYKGPDNKECYICTQCEGNYSLTDNYGSRGYGYAGTTNPKRTRADKMSTPTYGIELEVAGNIKNIDKIWKVANRELSIGYDTSVEGAEFELSYCPGTYYWYRYESRLQAICNLLQKDKWVKHNSETTGMHIHVGNIDKERVMRALIKESFRNEFFWRIIMVVGGRQLNRYCQPIMVSGHHDAISLSQKWGTLEFRFFKMTYDFETIMQRIKFLRQIIDNSEDDGIAWYKFKDETKEFILNELRKKRGMPTEQKEKIKIIFEKPIEPLETPGVKDLINGALERLTTVLERRQRRPYWIEEVEEDEHEEENDY